MSLFKIEKCPKGCYKHEEPNPKENKPCPKCGTMMVYSEKWYISYYFGHKKRRKAVAQQQRVAEAALGKIKGEIHEGRFFNKVASISWATAVKDFKKWIETNVRPKTKEMYLNSLKNLEPYFSPYTLEKITPQLVEFFKDERKKDGVKPATINRDLATLKRIFSLAETQWTTKEGQPYIEVNRIRKVKLLSEKDYKRSRWLTLEEIEKLLTACYCPLFAGNPKKHIIVLTALETGQRKDGILALRRKDIDFKEHTITFDTVKGGGKTITVDLTDRLERALSTFMKGQKVVTPYLFPSANKGRMIDPTDRLRSDADVGFKTALTKAGITDFTFHDLRHTFATWFYRKTKNWKALQEILGHEDISITMNRYAHLMDEDRKEAMKKFEEK
jgi:integrase